MPLETYGERLSRVREERGITQAELAERIGIPRRTLQAIELGETSKPQRRTRDKIDLELGLNREGDAAESWPPDVKAFLDMQGAFLSALPEPDRRRIMYDAIRRSATWNRVLLITSPDHSSVVGK